MWLKLTESQDFACSRRVLLLACRKADRYFGAGTFSVSEHILRVFRPPPAAISLYMREYEKSVGYLVDFNG